MDPFKRQDWKIYSWNDIGEYMHSKYQHISVFPQYGINFEYGLDLITCTHICKITWIQLNVVHKAIPKLWLFDHYIPKLKSTIIF